jgi:benzoate-CoA ligase family protein
MERQSYKYEKFIPRHYNITTKLIDDNIDRGLGEKVAVYYKDKSYTYRDMQRLINKVGNALSILGVRMEERVMLVMNDSPEMIASFYGAIKIGAVPIAINYMYTADDYRFLLNNSRARTLILHEEYNDEIMGWRDKFIYLKNTIVVGQPKRTYHIDFWDIVDRASDKLSAAYTTIDDPAFWNYTSGSTGVPKGAVHLQHDAFTCIDGYARSVLGITSEDILFSASKSFFVYGLGNNILYPFAVGASVVLLPERPQPQAVLDTIAKYRPTVFFGIPTLYASLLQHKDIDKYDLTSLRLCASAGEALPKEIFTAWKDQFSQEILDGIGSAEILHIFLSNRPGEAIPASSGRLVPGYSARIVDDHGNDLPDGEAGTLLIKGGSIAAFYWRHHAKTKSSMLGEWFNTGDKYYRDKDGYYFYCGRGMKRDSLLEKSLAVLSLWDMSKRKMPILHQRQATTAEAPRMTARWAV